MGLKAELKNIEVVDFFYYNPGLQSSGDLEAATKTITATAKPATADYSTNLTIASPPDDRLKITLLGLRWQVTIDSFGTGTTTLNYSVHVNGTERKTGSWTATGDQFDGVNLTEGQFNLGTANAIEIFLWVDAGAGATISVVQFWLAWGYVGSVWNWIADLAHDGYFSIQGFVTREGTGQPHFRVSGEPKVYIHVQLYYVYGAGANVSANNILCSKPKLGCGGTVQTDLNYPQFLHFFLRRLL